MDKHKRKVLDLLEVILEAKPDIDSVHNVFAIHAAQRDEDHIWIEDEEWAEWLEDYAKELQKDKETR